MSEQFRRNGSEISTPATPEARRRRRFPLRLPVRCKLTDPEFALRRVVATESVNIGSQGLVIATEADLQPGQAVEAAIDWPVLLDKHIGLTLVITGEVIRRSADEAAIRIDRYEFKTCNAELRRAAGGQRAGGAGAQTVSQSSGERAG
jgi:hypothetical protein